MLHYESLHYGKTSGVLKLSEVLVAIKLTIVQGSFRRHYPQLGDDWSPFGASEDFHPTHSSCGLFAE